MNLKVSKRFAVAGGVYTIQIEESNVTPGTRGKALVELMDCEDWIRATESSPKIKKFKEKKIATLSASADKAADIFHENGGLSDTPNFDS